MQKIRTRHFKNTLRAVLGFGSMFLAWFILFGRELATQYFNRVADGIFGILLLAAVCFLAVCFVPYFRGDKRWFAIPALLTVFFFVGVILLWQVPLPEAVTI
jgi:hypothetical protein